MSETLEQIMRSVAKEMQGNEDWYVEYGTRLVAALGAQGPVAYVDDFDNIRMGVFRGATKVLYAAPQLPQREGWQWVPKEATGVQAMNQQATDATVEKPEHSWFSRAALDVTAERRRQIEREGWTPEHDEEHNDGSLARAAAAYALYDLGVAGTATVPGLDSPVLWPWSLAQLKPKNRRRNLVRAAALLIAEIERLDRDALLTPSAAPKETT